MPGGESKRKGTNKALPFGKGLGRLRVSMIFWEGKGIVADVYSCVVACAAEIFFFFTRRCVGNVRGQAHKAGTSHYYIIRGCAVACSVLNHFMWDFSITL